jgi:RNA polymerase-binding transcription factor DksA
VIHADTPDPAKSAAMLNAERERKRLVKNARQRTMYGPTHRRRRAEFARHIERGDFPTCPRCGMGIGPDDLRLQPPHRAARASKLRPPCREPVKTSSEW